MNSKLILLTGLLLLTGCGITDALKGERKHISYYTLNNRFADQPHAQARGHLALEHFSSEKTAGGLHLVRRLDKDTLEYWLYPENHIWWAAPPQLAFELAMQHFRKAFAQVTRYPGSGRADVLLRIRLLQFEEVRGSGKAQGTAHVTLSVELSSLSHGTKQFVTRGSAEITHESKRSVDGSRIAAALSKALAEALDEVLTQLDR